MEFITKKTCICYAISLLFRVHEQKRCIIKAFFPVFMQFSSPRRQGAPAENVAIYITQKFRFYVLFKTKFNNYNKILSCKLEFWSFYSKNLGRVEGQCPQINHLGGLD